MTDIPETEPIQTEPPKPITQKKISQKKRDALQKARNAKASKKTSTEKTQKVKSYGSIILVSIGVITGIIFLLRKKFTGLLPEKKTIPELPEEKVTRSELLQMLEKLKGEISPPKKEVEVIDEETPLPKEEDEPTSELQEVKENPPIMNLIYT